MNFLRSSAVALLLLPLLPAAEAEVKVTPLTDRVRVEIDGQLFTELQLAGPEHVYYWPLLGPGGVKMTRSWPMESPAGEEHDHPHHRSMWFSHGLVNGVDFWTEEATHTKTPSKIPLGKIVHDKTLEAKGGPTEGVVKTAEKWIAADGSVPVTSVQTLRVYERPESERLFDFEITMTAGDKEVIFGDTKEGTFAIRIAESMRLKMPKNQPPGQGHILTSEGATDTEAWGKRARWVNMSGPVEGKTLGITMFEHPSNAGSPTRWHARDYGLFAANPFCEQSMEKDKLNPKADNSNPAGGLKLAPGKSVTFKYRILINEGAGDAVQLEALYKAYAATK